MNLNQRLEPLPELEVGLPERHEILLLAAVLIVGLTFVTPALSLVSGVPALVFVAVVGVVYGVLCVLFRQMLAGSLAGLLVTSTFMANVPLANAAYINSFPGHLGPELWLVQVTLAVSVVLVCLMEPREVLAGATKSDGLFAAFVIWTALAAVFGATMRLDTALYFSLLMFQGLLVFVLFRYAVQRNVLSFELIARVFVGVVLAQSLFAVAQFFNRGIFGVGSLGEYARKPIATVSLGPLGEFATGTYVAGFTGMSFLLATLIVLAVPVAAVLAIRESGWSRAALLSATLVMTAVLRATGTDAGRGAFIVAVVCLCAALIYSNRTAFFDLLPSRSSRTTTTSERVANAVMVALTVLTGIVALFYPSSASGQKSSITDINTPPTSSAGGGSGTGGGSGAGGSGAGGSGAGGSGAANAQPEAVESLLHGLSVPFFDISTLGGRLHQYVVGIDLFLQYPLFGIGGSNFRYYSIEYGFRNVVSLHNVYIAMLAETGLPGFVLFVALIGSVLWYGWKTTKRAKDGLLLLGVLCGIVGWLAYAFWGHPIDKVTTMVPFLVLLGAVVGSYSRQNT